MSSYRELPSSALALFARAGIGLACVPFLGCGGKTQQIVERDAPYPVASAEPENEPPVGIEPEPLPEPPVCAGDAPFSEPRPILSESKRSIAGAWLSADGLELVVGASNVDEPDEASADDLLRAQRSTPDADFGPLVAIEELNTRFLERHPTLTADGLTIYFESDRSGSSSDIYVATRRSREAAFGEVQLVEPVSTKRNDVPGAVSLHSDSLFFSADRLDGPGRENIYRAEREGDAAFGETFLISSIDSDSSNIAPAPSSDELTLYFSSNRGSADLGYDVYRARRTSLEGHYDLPRQVPELSSSTSDILAWLSADECTVLITREVPATSGQFTLLVAER